MKRSELTLLFNVGVCYLFMKKKFVSNRRNEQTTHLLIIYLWTLPVRVVTNVKALEHTPYSESVHTFAEIGTRLILVHLQAVELTSWE